MNETKRQYVVHSGKLLPMREFFPSVGENIQTLFAFDKGGDPVTGYGYVRTSPVVKIERFDPPSEEGFVALIETQNSIYKLQNWDESSNHQVAKHGHRY